MHKGEIVLWLVQEKRQILLDNVTAREADKKRHP